MRRSQRRDARALIAVAAAGVALAPSAAGAVGSSQVGCVDASGATISYRAKPPSCTFHARGKGFYGATQLTVVKMGWEGWGSAHPTAEGTAVANMGYRAQVTVRLSQRVTCNGHRRYKQATFRFADDGRTGKEKLDTCTD